MLRAFSLDVAFLPGEVGQRPNSVAIVVDVLRASSSIVTLLDRGSQSVGVAESPEAALKAVKSSGRVKPVLCGEVGGLPPYGFDHGNSPSEFSRLDFSGRHIVMSTTNGTNAIRACREAGTTLIGALLNANAVVRTSLDMLGDLEEIVVVCSGVGGRFVLDDAVTAGYLCHIILSDAKVRNLPLNQTNSAIAAYRLYHSYPNLTAALNESDSAKALHSVRLAHDISFCGQTSMTKQVPRLQVEVPKQWEERQGLYLL